MNNTNLRHFEPSRGIPRFAYFVAVVFLIIVTCNLGIKTALAAQSTPSATPTSASDVEKSLQERIKKQLEDGIDNISQAMREQTSISGVRAFVGAIESISAKAITIKTINGVKQAEISDSTTITNDGKANPKITDLPVGNAIIAIGRSADNQTQASVKLVVYPPAEPDVRTVTTATVTDVDVKAKTITLSSDKLPAKAIKLSTRVQLYDSALTKISLQDIGEDQRVFVIVHQLDTGPVLTRLINLSSNTPTPTIKAVCGDKACTASETPETCPTDCQQ